MSWRCCFLLAVLSLLCSLGHALAPGKIATYYTAAVVEYAPVYSTKLTGVTKQEALGIMTQNLQNYSVFVQDASRQGADIIIFPEDGLFGANFVDRSSITPYLETIPNVDYQNPTPIYNPCIDGSFNDRPVLQYTSCLARNHSIYMVIHMGDRQLCTLGVACKDGSMQYSTLVAFDPSGQILAKYYKRNLYFEPQWDPSPTEEGVYFQTSFGVRIGMFICFDIQYPAMQRELMNRGIVDFAFPSMWVNNSPVITSIQEHQAWSRLWGVNLMASGIGLSYYNSGSGIYSNGVPIQYTFNPTTTPMSKLLVGRLPILAPRSQPLPNAYPILSPSAARKLFDEVSKAGVYGTNTFIANSGTRHSLVATSGNLTCSAQVVVNSSYSSANNLYALIAFSGFYNNILPTRICAVLHCESGASCTAWNSIASASFASLSLTSSSALTGITSTMLLSMIATNNGMLLSDSEIASVSFGNSSISWSSSTVTDPILNVALFDILWQY